MFQCYPLNSFYLLLAPLCPQVCFLCLQLHCCCYCSVTQPWLTLCDPMDYSTPGLPVCHQTPRVYANSCPLSRRFDTTISSSAVRFSSHLQSFPASGSFQMIQLFSSGGHSIGVSASFQFSPSNEYSGQISLRMDWLNLFAVQGTPKSLLQHHSSKASVLQHSAFFIV